ncbi:hypothetical protein V8G54_017930 [Vigna mungo]|uniref:Uncharacterized protein n=1 Tax=Vigna mungo TaxID=3915 RepID=A0AAQ3RR05_VIGMU
MQDLGRYPLHCRRRRLHISRHHFLLPPPQITALSHIYPPICMLQESQKFKVELQKLSDDVDEFGDALDEFHQLYLVFVANALLDFYSKHDRVPQVRKLFYEMPEVDGK